MDGHDGSFDTIAEPAAEGPLDGTDDSTGFSAGDDGHYGMIANDDSGSGAGSDDTATAGTTTGYDSGTDSGYGDSTSTTSSGSEIQVDVNGQEYELPATIDVDHDGHLDAAVVRQGDETILFGDSDGDGNADVAIEYDSSGQPIAMAESDGDGNWQVDQETPGGSSDPTGTDTTGSDTTGSDSTGYGDDTTTDTTSTDTTGTDTTSTDTTTGADGTSGPTVSIQVDGQEYTEAAQYDSNGDAVAQVHLSDGDTVLAGDTNHDGQADVAEIEDSTGQVVDVQYVDPSTGEWVDAGPPNSGS